MLVPGGVSKVKRRAALAILAGAVVQRPQRA
jgi:hypothetical protein